MSWDPSYLPESASIGTSPLQEFNYRISSYLAICDGVAIAYYSVTGLYESNNGLCTFSACCAAVLPPPPLHGMAQEQVQMPPSSAANHAAVPSLDDDDDNFDVDATTQLGPTGLQPGTFQRYYNDQSQLEAKKKSGVLCGG